VITAEDILIWMARPRQFTYVDHDKRIQVGKGVTVLSESQISETEKSDTLHLLCEEIYDSHVSGNKEFMAAFDELGKKFGFERFNKYAVVTFAQLHAPHYGEDYLNDLKSLYGEFFERVQK
jgi:hypothetical protein